MPDRPGNGALFPGSFDPVTYGHLDVIQRAARIFDRLIVAVGENPVKQQIFTPQERVEILVKHSAHLPNVEVLQYAGLTVSFAKQLGVRAIVRGIRDNVDLHAELEIANTNLMIGDIETIFLMTSHEHVLTSSTLIRQIVQIGGYNEERLARLVPPDVAEMLRERLR